jgi:hypothetical protein
MTARAGAHKRTSDKPAASTVWSLNGEIRDDNSSPSGQRALCEAATMIRSIPECGYRLLLLVSRKRKGAPSNETTASPSTRQPSRPDFTEVVGALNAGETRGGRHGWSGGRLFFYAFASGGKAGGAPQNCELIQ